MAAKEFMTPKCETNVEDGEFLTFTHKHEWQKINDNDLSYITGFVFKTFSGSGGIYQVMQMDPLTVDDGVYILLLHTINEDTGANKVLFTNITHEEALFLKNNQVNLWH